MFGNKDNEQYIPEDLQQATQEEEIEYYDMSAFETKMLKRLDILESKIDTVLHEVEDNQHRLKGIQFQFTRQLIIRVIKLAIMAAIIFYVYNNFISPLLIGASSKYYQAEQMLNRFDAVNKNASSTIDTIKNMFPDAANVLDTLRPNQSADSEVEN